MVAKLCSQCSEPSGIVGGGFCTQCGYHNETATSPMTGRGLESWVRSIAPTCAD